jgi:hypothetical protein
MSDKALALSAILPPSPTDPDYDAICATVMASERGRRFLEEYARRNRATDTGVLLDAIGRLEGVVRSERTRHADLALRTDLLDMAKAIAQTRAEVTEVMPTAGRVAAARADTPRDLFAAAERLKEVAWTMRERGLDFATCAQIEELGSAILSAAALRYPGDRRAQKLAEVLAYLEARIGGMIEACAPAAPQELRTGTRDFGIELLATPAAETADANNMRHEAAAAPGAVGADTPAPSLTRAALQNVSELTTATPAPAAQSKSSSTLPPLSDPLATLRTLSDEERIALFT